MPAPEITFRLETPADYRAVEALTRDAFFNQYQPGCDEHYLAHVLRDAPAFVPQLDFVAEGSGQLVGNIMYTRARVLLDAGGELQVLSFGPLSVLPAFQGQGVGSRLVRHTQEQARALGFCAILIYGDPAFYGRVGFAPAETYGIATPQNEYRAALQACELTPGALANAAGRFVEAEAYQIDPAAASAFDRAFPPRPLETDNAVQRRFHEVLAMVRPRA